MEPLRRIGEAPREAAFVRAVTNSSAAAGWTPRTAGRRLLEVARDEGARSVWFKLLGETVYRRLLLYEMTLTDSSWDGPLTASVTVEQLREADADEYGQLASTVDGGEIRRRLAAGHRCFVARRDGQIVHASWTARDLMWSPYLTRHIPLADGESCTYETYTEPSARGEGIGGAVRRFALSQLREVGYRRLLATIYPENRAGRRLVETLGYCRIGAIGYVKLGPWRRDFCRVVRGGAPPRRLERR